ncbi:MAG: MlaD family protein [Actinomycetota bacterium]
MGKYRTPINVATFIALSAFLVWFGLTNLVMTQADGPQLNAEFTDASGLRARNDVTMRGVVVGTVQDVSLTEDGTRVEMELDPGVEIPEGTEAQIVRRSPIGELTVELEPGEGDPLESGSTLAMSDTLPPPDVAETIEVFADFLGAVPSNDLNTVVSELSKAVKGRSEDLARFTRATVELPEELLRIEDELESLIVNGPDLTGVFADNAEVFADDLAQTAGLADILRDRRYDLVELYRNGARFTEVAGGLIEDEKANLACLVRDIGDFNSSIATHRDWLAETLDKNHFFFDALEQTVQKDGRGWSWFRVQLLPHTEPSARRYGEQRPVPDVLPGRGCTSRYGTGVEASEGKMTLAPDSEIRR